MYPFPALVIYVVAPPQALALFYAVIRLRTQHLLEQTCLL